MYWAVAVKEDFIHATSDFHKKIMLWYPGSAHKTACSEQWDNYSQSFTLYSAVPNNPSNALKFR